MKTPEQLSMMGLHIGIEVNQDKKLAPRYDPAETTQLGPVQAVITEMGTVANLPIVDFQLEDANGKKYFFCVTGRILNMLAGSLRGINMRNHGNPEP